MESENLTNTVHLEEMVRFLEGKGGEVRFDTYMREHLMGAMGYYQNAVEIGKFGDFETFVYNPGFAHLLFEFLQTQNLTGKDFLEIGGGDGVFKRQYLEHDPGVHYISVDASSKLAALQKGHGQTLVASAKNLGLADESIEGIIFANELLDALPCRVFKIGNDNERIVIREEGYVSLEGPDLTFSFNEAERDDFLETYENFLNERMDSHFEEGEVVSVAPESEEVLRESMRVLRSGKVILVDYGFSGANQSYRRDPKEMPYFRDGFTFSGVEGIVRQPYQVDITFMSDFPFLEHLAQEIHPTGAVRQLAQHHFFGDILRTMSVDDRSYQRLSNTSTFNILMIDK